MAKGPIPQECWPITRRRGSAPRPIAPLPPQYAEGERCETCWAWLPAAFTGIGRWMRRRAHRRKWGHEPELRELCDTCGSPAHKTPTPQREPR